ncbi:DUF4132 domain-containing protein [Serratia sp. (in: enterobacteria)]|uniref:DUF4132 domain-containing protein n=1 Tax=Serratia sp. (in: enterobacteria) TaxID=616 RepID=UPI00398A2DD7
MSEQQSINWLILLDQHVDNAINNPDQIYAISPETLGGLWADILENQRNPSSTMDNLANLLYRKVREQQLQPVLDNAAALRVLPLARDWQEMVSYLGWLSEPPVPALTDFMGQQFANEQALDRQVSRNGRYGCAIMAYFSGAAALERWQQTVNEQFSDQSFILLEASFIPSLSANSRFTLFSFGQGYFKAGEEDPARQLSEDPTYCSFAFQALNQAIAHLEAIHNQPATYRADGAFSVDEAHVIARAARVAAWRDESWFAAAFPRLLALVCSAPGEAKTVPSQSLAIALGHAIEGIPTPESVLALQHWVEKVRHAGVQKKLKRNLKPAQLALAMRGEYAFRNLSATKNKKQRETLLRVLESGIYCDTHYAWQTWQQAVTQFAWVNEISCQLIWQVESAAGVYHSMMPTPEGQWIDCWGNACAVPDPSRIRLWHLLQVSPAEHDAWQGSMVRLGIEQPFKQAFREIYSVAAMQDFSGYILDLQKLVGLARAEGWKVNYDAIERWFGGHLFVFSLHTTLFHGVQGQGRSGELVGYRQIKGRRERIAEEQIPAVVLSEALRAVDLLVSMSALARGENDDETGFTSMKEALDERKACVEQYFADELASQRLQLCGHYAQVGDKQVHLTTGRVTCHGKPVILPCSRVEEACGDLLSGEIVALLNRLLSR